MITPLLLEASNGFDLEEVHRYLAAQPFVARDAFDPNTFMLGNSKDDIDTARADRERDPSRFPYHVILITPAAAIIVVAFRTSDVEPARRFVHWLRARYELKVMDEEFNDITQLSTENLEAFFGPPREPLVQRATTNDFPFGARIAGRYVVSEAVCGTSDRGLFRGYDEATDHRVLITLGAGVDIERMRDLEWRVPGIASVRHIGPLDSDHNCVAMVEDLPPGTTTSTMSFDPATAAWLGVAIARIVRAGPFGGLRPELVFVDGKHVMIAPRCERFLAAVTRSVAPCFESFYMAPEVLAGGEVRPAADVFSLCAMIAQWVSGEHPFEGTGGEQAISIAIGRRRRWRGLPIFGALVDEGLQAEPTSRPSLPSLMSTLFELASVPR